MDYTKLDLKHKYQKYKIKYIQTKKNASFGIEVGDELQYNSQKGGVSYFINNTHKHNFQSLCLREHHTIDLFGRIDEYIKNTDQSWNYIIAPELYKELMVSNNKFFLLDVRKPQDYKKGHIKGAKNIFWKDLFSSNNIDKLPCPKHNPDITLVIICYVGHTASQTLVLLRLLGFKVVVLKYGMGISPVEKIPRKGWLDYNLPIEIS